MPTVPSPPSRHRQSLRYAPLAIPLVLAAVTITVAGRGGTPHWGGLAAMTAFYLATYALGLWAARRVEADSFSDLVLAGRRLGLGVGVFTMTATWVDGGYINGTVEQTYSAGLLHVQAPWAYAMSLAIGGLWFAPIMRRHGFTTLLDPFHRRFGARAAALLYLPAVTGELFWTSAILTALGTTFGVVLDLDYTWSIVLAATIVVGYTMSGGLWAVAVTDVAQLTVLVLGLGIVVPFVADAVGGFGPALEQYRARMAVAPPVNWWSWTDSALLLIFGGIPWHVYFQRVLASRDEHVARRLSLLAAGCCLLAAIPPALIGVLAHGADWAALGIAEPEAARLLPVVLAHLTPPAVAAIGLGAVSAAVMSSMDSSILSSSTMTAWNVYRPLVNPQASRAALTGAVRGTVLVLGVAATLIALQVKSIYTLWVLCSDLVYCVLFPQILLALWDRRANRHGSYAGMLVAFAIRVSAGEPLLGLPRLLPLPQDASGLDTVPIKTIAMISGLVVMWCVSRLTAARCPAVPLETAVTAEANPRRHAD
jgi:high affinity choline transporter 7